MGKDPKVNISVAAFAPIKADIVGGQNRLIGSGNLCQPAVDISNRSERVAQPPECGDILPRLFGVAQRPVKFSLTVTGNQNADAGRNFVVAVDNNRAEIAR